MFLVGLLPPIRPSCLERPWARMGVTQRDQLPDPDGMVKGVDVQRCFTTKCGG